MNKTFPLCRRPARSASGRDKLEDRAAFLVTRKRSRRRERVKSALKRKHNTSYVRVGSETRTASEAQYAEMFAQRTSKAGKLLEYKGKQVTVLNRHQTGGSAMESVWGGHVVIQDCNSQFVTLKEVTMAPQSFSLDRVDLSFDHEQNRLRVELRR